MNVIGFSGGKDSTALALRWAELGKKAVLLFTPTGDEFKSLDKHIMKIHLKTGFSVVKPAVKYDLFSLINHWNALTNWRQRWCTRMLKIDPCKAWLYKHPKARLLVGLRADEEERKGLYSDQIETVFPLREWGWGINEVWDYIDFHDVKVPKRTDCRLCFYQKVIEWYELYKTDRETYQKGIDLEDKTGYTFRSPGRDSWPADLRSLAGEFERGRKPKGNSDQMNLFDDIDKCRVCSL